MKIIWLKATKLSDSHFVFLKTDDASVCWPMGYNASHVQYYKWASNFRLVEQEHHCCLPIITPSNEWEIMTVSLAKPSSVCYLPTVANEFLSSSLPNFLIAFILILTQLHDYMVTWGILVLIWSCFTFSGALLPLK